MTWHYQRQKLQENSVLTKAVLQDRWFWRSAFIIAKKKKDLQNSPKIYLQGANKLESGLAT